MRNRVSINEAGGSPGLTSSELLQKTILPAEMQVILASLFDGVEDAGMIPGKVASVMKSSPAVQHVTSRTRVDGQALFDKLDALPPAALIAIQQGVARYRTMSTVEMFGPDNLPSLATLKRLDLVEAPGHAAWGLAVVRRSDWKTCEFVLRQDPTTMGVGRLPYSQDQASSGLIDLVSLFLDGKTVPKGQQMAFGLCGLIALHTGWRYFRVDECKNNHPVIEIPRQDLLGDLYRGELGGLILQGINAPEVSTA